MIDETTAQPAAAAPVRHKRRLPNGVILPVLAVMIFLLLGGSLGVAYVTQDKASVTSIIEAIKNLALIVASFYFGAAFSSGDHKPPA